MSTFIDSEDRILRTTSPLSKEPGFPKKNSVALVSRTYLDPRLLYTPP